MQRSKNSYKNIYSALFIFIGFCLILISIILEEYAELKILKILLTLLAHLGIGAIVIGVLNILIETNHWTEYFKERLTDIVIDKKYMEDLNSEKLIDLQTEVLKVYFKDSNIGGEGGFLKFYQDHIQELIGSPYRVLVEDDLYISYLDNSNEKLQIHEKLSWHCKSNGGKIQKEIRWLTNEDEFETIEHQGVKLQHDSFRNDSNKNGKISIPFNQFKSEWIIDNTKGFIIPISQYQHLDGLQITTEVKYTITWYRFIAWRMAHPTKGLSITIRYPVDLVIGYEIFSRQAGFEIINNERGYFKVITHGWVMPNEGIPFQFYKRDSSWTSN